MRKIFHLSQSVGSGKTEAAIKHIGEHSNEAYLYVAPTVELVNEIKKRLEDGASNLRRIEAITARDTPDDDLGRLSTTRRAIRMLRDHIWQGSCALVITTETFRSVATQLSEIEAARITIFLDEGIEVFSDATFQGADLDIFTSLVRKEGQLLTPAPGARDRLYDIAYSEHRARRNADVMKTNRCCRKLAELIVSDLYDCVGSISANRIDAIGILKPDVFLKFKQFVIVTAALHRNLLAKIWRSQYGVTLEAFELPEQLWDSHTEKGELIQIWHALHADDSSSKQCIKRNAKTGEREATSSLDGPNGQRAIDQIAKEVGKFFGDEKFLWVANNDFEDHEGSLESGKRLPARSDGLDKFRDYHNVASLLVVNPPPHISRPLAAFTGLGVSEICFALKFSYTYQAVGRCSIRDRNCQEPINLVVLSKEEAKALAELFDGATVVGQLGNLPCLSRLDKERRASSTPKERRTPHRKARYKYVRRMEDKGQAPLAWDEWLERVRKPELAKKCSNAIVA